MKQLFKVEIDTTKENNQSAVNEICMALELLPKNKYTVSIEKQTKERSTAQNKYMWGVVYKMIGDYIGEFPEEVHEMMKSMFNSNVKELPCSGSENLSIKYGKSTQDLSTVQFEEYLSKIRMWAFHYLNLSIPEPNRSDCI